ncbi:M14 family zinc carboxypeptidase [Tenacibaculum ovolyticum]|uniref:M14 family zinc carboxypeptidase n=1 Tax=Tenacibaculum ovolyticum TaxID=104270 RepID=UPI003BAC3FBC
MKKLATIALCLSFSLFSFSQDLSKRVTIKNPSQQIQQLLVKNGIDLRCGSTHKENSIQLELSTSELNILKKEKIPYSIDIENLTSFYQKRISENLPKAVRNLQLRKSRKLANKTAVSNTIINSSLQYNGCSEIDWQVPTNFNLGSMGGCLTVSETIAELDEMRTKFPNLISAKADASPTNQKTHGNQQGTTTWNGQTVYYVKITGNQSLPEGSKPQVLYTSMIHSREVSSLMSNIYFMWYLLENYATDTAIKNLVDNNELYFIPIVNPDGLRWNEHVAPNGGGMQRKNLRPNTGGTGNTAVNRGVDLNRNFDYFWGTAGSGSSGTPTSESYRGPSAFSEPESQILRDFVLNRNIKTCLMNHSYANGIPHPYGGNPTFTSGREDEMHKWHEDMTKYNRYVSGATIFSAANGVADDWMVGGNTDTNGSAGSGKNILATTPEHGDSGFWPNPTEIVPIAKRAVRIYLMSAYQAGKYAKLHDLTQSNITSLTANLTFGIERISQTSSDFTVTITPISTNISSIIAPTPITGINILTQQNVTGSLVLNNNITANEKIEYNVKLSNDEGVFYDANFEKYYNPTVLLSDSPDTDGLSNWNNNGWVSSTTDAFSGNTALRSNSTSPYPNNSTKTLTSKNSYDLSTSSKVLIQFYTKWDIERNFDFVEIQAATNGTNWQALCGNYNKPNATSSSNSAHSQKNGTSKAFQSTNSSGRVYDGDQMNKWVMEEIVIDANNNSFLLNATSASFRFRLKSDANNKKESYSTTYDGYFIDDFKIISISVPCEVSIPNSITTSNITSNTAKINWNNVPSANYDLRYRKIGTSNWSVVTDIVGATHNITNLSPSTEYEVQVRSKCDTNNTSAYSASVNLTTTAINYCTSKGANVNDEYIQKVVLGTINNTSTGGNGYSDHTSISTNLTKGETNTITITPKWTGTAYDEGYGVWIDYNKDGDFSDANETVWTKAKSKTTPVSGTFTVPTSAIEGPTRMRVILKYNATPVACEASFSYGEVEDYTVTIIGAAPDTQAPTAPSSLASSNITETSLTLNWVASTDNVAVTSYDVYNGSTKIGTTTNATTYNVTGLTAATAYTFSVKAKDAAGNISLASNTLNVTTNAPDTQAPNAPIDVTASNITQTTATLNWTASTDNVAVTAYEVFNGATSIAIVSGTSANITGLTANTSYTYTVKAKDAAGNVSIPSSNVTFTTLNAVINYCASKGNRVTYEWIDYVSFGGMTNTTAANGGYGDFTSKIATVTKGSTTQLVVSAGFNNSAYSEFFTVWIDYNQNGTFETNEKVMSNSSNSATNRSSNVTIPTTALLGATKMRVSMKYNSASTACETFADGEVEDYTVNITDNISRQTNILTSSDSHYIIYPNPAASFITIKNLDLKRTTFKITNAIGQLVKSGRLINDNFIDILSLKKGVYLIEINDGGKKTIKKFIKN